MKISDGLFYCVQALLMNHEFGIFDKIRPFFYRLFFKKIGKGTRICAKVQFKYPSDISIGSCSYIGRSSILVGLKGLLVGDYALIGAGSKICTTSHIIEDPDKPFCLQGIRAKEIIIGNNVWLGFDSKILLGVRISDNCIIAANSVLLEDSNFAKNSIIAGIPAVLKRKTDAK
ncbi:MAG: acyltransferase [Pseudomonadota bacterium]|jgi:acetyltransferase-like isoleucine patch superfamily enzyme|nr:acyltransferase [Alphaproteobacteria bacterium]